MAQNKQALKRRIRSIKATMKITGAMEMIATSKLAKQKTRMETNRMYANTLYHTFQRVLDKANVQDVDFLKPREGKTLTLVFVSDMGLCGAYNANVLAMIKAHLNPVDLIWVIGSKEGAWLKRQGFTPYQHEEGDKLTYGHLTKTIDKILDLYKDQTITKVQVLYTRFINSMTFEPSFIQLLPLQENTKPQSAQNEEEKLLQDIIFEPDPVTLINQLVPMLLNSLLYSVWLESKTSEQAARRLAMDNATDNAEELMDELILKFNQSRQSAITQEITEIVAGAQAL